MKIRNTILLLLVMFLAIDAEAKPKVLIDMIKKVLPNATIKKLPAKDHYKEAFEIKFKQPLDHNNPSVGSFEQRIFLCHADFKKPMVMVTEGYNGRYVTNEVAKILQSNQLTVEYRYMGASKPAKTDWQYLTNDQATEDLHRIRQLFKKIYKKKWVSTGISKGGSTCLIYKSKYPKDICVAVPYVAPIALAQEDKRTDEHIKTIGTAECRKKLNDLQRYALENRTELVAMIDTFAVNNKKSFSIGHGAVLEFAVLEFTFSFWQWGASCDEIPERGASVQEIFDYLNKIVGFDFYADSTCDFFLPSFYQFLTESGYYGFIYDHVKDLLVSLENPSNLIFGPKDADLTFDPEPMRKVHDFLSAKGNKILYIYGEVDTWTACGFTPTPNTDALRMVKEGGSHTTRIASFSEADRQKIYDQLKKWLKVEIYPLQP